MVLAAKPGHSGDLPSVAYLLKRDVLGRELHAVDDLGGGAAAGDLHMLDPSLRERAKKLGPASPRISPTASSHDGRVFSNPFEACITSAVSRCWPPAVSSGQAACPSPAVWAWRYERTARVTCCCAIGRWLDAL
ncbi:MAG: hypothetical protein ACXVH1_27630 [Solirubrobacteraceae bacterium]